MRAENITATVIARNEARDLPKCLDNVQHVTTNIVVVDDFSRDNTLEIAKDWGARVYRRGLVMDFAQQRNFALDQVETAWALVLDADEVLSPDLIDEILGLPDDPDAEAFRIPRKNFYKGRELKARRFSDQTDRHVRLFRSDLRYQDDRPVHEYIGWQPDLEIADLENPILHYTYATLREYIRKTRLYSEIEGIQPVEVPGLFHALGVSVVRFLRDEGYRDGIFGLIASLGETYYELNLRQVRKRTSGDKLAV